MSIRCGFFNSVNNDKTYDAEDMGKIFEGIISDGVFNNINKGNSFKVTKNNNTMTVNVAAGKAWFYNRYFEIVGNETISLRNGDVNPRWDAICIKIDNSSSAREGSLYAYEGEPNADPVKPTITSTDDIKLIPIAYIKIPASAVNVNNAVITSTIGTSLCPYSEPSLDPRRAVYAFEGETAEASIFNYTVSYQDVELSSVGVGDTANVYNPNRTPTHNYWGRRASKSINYSDLGLEEGDEYYIIPIMTVARIVTTPSDRNTFPWEVIHPLVVKYFSDYIYLGTDYIDLSLTDSSWDYVRPDLKVNVRLMIIKKEEI